MFLHRCALLVFLSSACGGVSTNGGDAGSSDDGGIDAPIAVVEPNIAFVTSSTHDGTFGGDALADSICALRATEAGLPGTYVAWLSGPTVAARDRLAGASGWVRVDGRPFANSVTDLLAGKIFYPVALDESGVRQSAELWTATTGDGGYDVANGNCGGWANNENGPGPTVGDAMGGLGRFTSSGTGSCVSARAFLCFGVDREATVDAPSDVGRIAFVTEGNVSGTTGLAEFESQCATEATAAGLSGSFTAGVTVSELSVSDRVTLAGDTWVRPDGVKLFESPNDMLDNNGQLAPIQITASGLAKNAEVWTGAAGWANVNPNCNGWLNAGGTGIIGISALGGINGASFDGSGCTQSRPVYCFED